MVDVDREGIWYFGKVDVHSRARAAAPTARPRSFWPAARTEPAPTNGLGELDVVDVVDVGNIAVPVPVGAGMVVLTEGGVTTGTGVELTGAALEDGVEEAGVEDGELDEDEELVSEDELDSELELDSSPVGVAPPLICGVKVSELEQGMKFR